MYWLWIENAHFPFWTTALHGLFNRIILFHIAWIKWYDVWLNYIWMGWMSGFSLFSYYANQDNYIFHINKGRIILVGVCIIVQRISEQPQWGDYDAWRRQPVSPWHPMAVFGSLFRMPPSSLDFPWWLKNPSQTGSGVIMNQFQAIALLMIWDE